MLTYKTRDGDVLDDVVWRHYGAQNAAMLRAVFAASPGLAEQGELLPEGIEIVLPDIEQPANEIQSVALWD
jgi:phage tail protein X